MTQAPSEEQEKKIRTYASQCSKSRDSEQVLKQKGVKLNYTLFVLLWLSVEAQDQDLSSQS